ncbi:uncharacterized protein LOC129883523 [Solanum dulcamara]|uniref:uncharacterized protein LOC129883523 n=1 Tax=Solanum dulcamara TaxID=45834 RepID=UPI00248526EB|nr:uncharacterized protein LOC129883523 [Solanum dulcamara]
MDHQQHLTIKLRVRGSQEDMLVSLVYAKCTQTERLELWDSIEDLSTSVDIPWMIRGDFNAITSEDEKFGGLPVTINEIQDFRGCIQNCGISDLGFSGSKFTWWNGQNGDDLKAALTQWSKAIFGNIFQEIKALEEIIKVKETQFQNIPTPTNRQELHKVQAELNKYLHLEEEFWKQKAGMQWFQDGDRNTKTFHAHVQDRRKRMQIRRIQGEDGNWIEEEGEIIVEAIKFYTAQFTKEEDPKRF